MIWYDTIKLLLIKFRRQIIAQYHYSNTLIHSQKDTSSQLTFKS